MRLMISSLTLSALVAFSGNVVGEDTPATPAEEISAADAGKAKVEYEEEIIGSVSLAERLDALSPLQVLGRGYALARLQSTGTPLRDVRQVRVGEMITLELQKGRLEAQVSSVDTEKKSQET